VVFTDPYMHNEHNRWTSPQLDSAVAAVRADLELKAAVAALKDKFVQSTEALIHGDLHTGSIMVSGRRCPGSTRNGPAKCCCVRALP
jgi:5-methylthioribose kinase